MSFIVGNEYMVEIDRRYKSDPYPLYIRVKYTGPCDLIDCKSLHFEVHHDYDKYIGNFRIKRVVKELESDKLSGSTGQSKGTRTPRKRKNTKESAIQSPS